MTNIVAYELVETKISPDILDTIGRSFKFRHGSGIAEWLKNSLDNYLRLRDQNIESRNGGWPVLVDLVDGTSRSNGPNLTLIDFGGTSREDVEDFFLHWGSRSAATLGTRIENVALTGGHGNGGKFYMRQMWRRGARFLTYRGGKATSLVVMRRTDGKTGYWEFRDRPGSWRESLGWALPAGEHLGDPRRLIEHLERTDPALVAELECDQRGLTVVAGRCAEQVLSSNDVVRGARWDRQRLADSVSQAVQARRPIRELAVCVFANSQLSIRRLSPEEIEPDPKWGRLDAALPVSVLKDAAFATSEPTAGVLRLDKAGVPLTGRLSSRNAVSVLDRHSNPIASYPVKDLPLPGYSPIGSFMHGELELQFPGFENLVENDREKLVNSATTRAILDWLGEQVWARVAGIDKAERDESRAAQLQLATIINESLNTHAKRFLEALQPQIYVDVIEDPEGGGPGPLGGDGTGSGGQGTGGEGEGGKREVPGTSEAVRRPRFPQVLLSGIDADPATGGAATKHLTDRHPPLEQDDTDRRHNVWWINTQHPFAQEAFKRGGAQGSAFKSYQLHMFRDVVQREGLRFRQRREAELSLDRVENELTEISNRFLAELPYDLIGELLD